MRKVGVYLLDGRDGGKRPADWSRALREEG
jgi:hypothetical protein